MTSPAFMTMEQPLRCITTARNVLLDFAQLTFDSKADSGVRQDLVEDIGEPIARIMHLAMERGEHVPEEKADAWGDAFDEITSDLKQKLASSESTRVEVVTSCAVAYASVLTRVLEMMYEIAEDMEGSKAKSLLQVVEELFGDSGPGWPGQKEDDNG
jgi:hypothetical protein